MNVEWKNSLNAHAVFFGMRNISEFNPMNRVLDVGFLRDSNKVCGIRMKKSAPCCLYLVVAI